MTPTPLASMKLTDEMLDPVSGGGLMKALETIGQETLDGAKFGARIGMNGGIVFAFGGLMAGSAVGALNGVKTVARDAIRDLIG